jgi:nitrogenase molybdenum-iron protein beta chain
VESCGTDEEEIQGSLYAAAPAQRVSAPPTNSSWSKSKISKREVPYELEEPRGQLVDILLDSHQYTYQKTAAIYGDPDTVLGLAELCIEMGMVPKYMVTGTPKEDFTKNAQILLESYGLEGCTAKANADLFEMHQWIKNDPVDLLIGTSYGKAIAKAEDIPLVRAGSRF